MRGVSGHEPTSTSTNYRHMPRDFLRTVIRTFVSDELYGPILNEARITDLATDNPNLKPSQITHQKKCERFWTLSELHSIKLTGGSACIDTGNAGLATIRNIPAVNLLIKGIFARPSHRQSGPGTLEIF